MADDTDLDRKLIDLAYAPDIDDLYANAFYLYSTAGEVRMAFGVFRPTGDQQPMVQHRFHTAINLSYPVALQFREKLNELLDKATQNMGKQNAGDSVE
jgi:hypothetical protein